jgi:hypothetical protein
MARSIVAVACVSALLLLSPAARAERLGKGRSLVTVAVSGHRGEFVTIVPLVSVLGFPGALDRNEIGEVGGEIAYYRFLSDQWTLGIAGGYHGSNTRTTGSGVSGTTDTHSYSVRIGGDRFAFIDDNVALYAGPGVVVTRGQSKSNGEEDPQATEIGLNGRIGMYARLTEDLALIGHIGQVLSHTTGKNEFGTISWWTSTHEGSVGVAIDF